MIKVPPSFTGISDDGICYLNGVKTGAGDLAKAMALANLRTCQSVGKNDVTYGQLLSDALKTVSRITKEKTMAKNKQSKKSGVDVAAVLASLSKVEETGKALEKQGAEMVAEAKKKAPKAPKAEPKSEPVVQKTEPKKPATLKELGIEGMPEDLQGVVQLAQKLQTRLDKGEFEGNHSMTWGAKLWIGNLVRRAKRMAEQEKAAS